MPRVMLAAVFFIIIMSIGASAVSLQGDDLGSEYVITGETLTADAATFAEGEQVNTTNSHIEDATYVTDTDGLAVRDENGILMVEGEDYEWYANNGSLRILAGDLTDDASLDIDYNFVIPSQQQTELISLVGAQVSIGQGLMWAFGAIIAVAIMRLLAGVG